MWKCYVYDYFFVFCFFFLLMYLCECIKCEQIKAFSSSVIEHTIIICTFYVEKKSTQKIRQPVPVMAQHHINSFFVIIAHSAPYKTSSSPLLAFFCYVKFIIIVSLCSALAYIFSSNSLWLKSKKFFDGR